MSPRHWVSGTGRRHVVVSPDAFGFAHRASSSSSGHHRQTQASSSGFVGRRFRLQLHFYLSFGRPSSSSGQPSRRQCITFVAHRQTCQTTVRPEQVRLTGQAGASSHQVPGFAVRLQACFTRPVTSQACFVVKSGINSQTSSTSSSTTQAPWLRVVVSFRASGFFNPASCFWLVRSTCRQLDTSLVRTSDFVIDFKLYCQVRQSTCLHF